MSDAVIDLLKRLREEDGSAREADERHDFALARQHDTVAGLLADRLSRTPITSGAAAAAVLELAEAMILGSATDADADAADLADALEIGAVGRRLRAGTADAADRAYLAYLAADLGGLGNHHAGAVRLVRVVARAACRPSFGLAQAA